MRPITGSPRRPIQLSMPFLLLISGACMAPVMESPGTAPDDTGTRTDASGNTSEARSEQPHADAGATNLVPANAPDPGPIPSSDHPTIDPNATEEQDAPEPGTAGNLPDPPATGSGVEVQGRTLLVNGQPFHVRAVAWNPVHRGAAHPDGVDYAAFAARDIPLMKEAGFNAVRTYALLDDVGVLDQLHAAGIRVINQPYGWGGAGAHEVAGRIAPIQNHPAILMWMVGNEWNYNGLYAGLSFEQARDRVAEVSRNLKLADSRHPVATSYGELPDSATLAALPNVDIWGINSYRGFSFGDLFDDWATRSSKPLLLSEYGADAYNALLPGADEQAQADAVVSLTAALRDHGSAYQPDGVCVGGAIFEWVDEWWKDGNGSWDVHDTGGSAPGSGPHPDGVFNEEWWGLVDIDRNPRRAWHALRDLFASY